MVRTFWLGAFCAVLFCVACTGGGSGAGTAGTPSNAKPGWNADNIKSLLCDLSALGQPCQCYINRITPQLTPDQVSAANGNQSDPNFATLMGAYQSCSDNGSPQNPGTVGTPPGSNGSTNLSYNLTENGCSTGYHSFPSLAKMCNGLQSAGLNSPDPDHQDCALSLRMTYFTASGCPGTFQELP